MLSLLGAGGHTPAGRARRRAEKEQDRRSAQHASTGGAAPSVETDEQGKPVSRSRDDMTRVDDLPPAREDDDG